MIPLCESSFKQSQRQINCKLLWIRSKTFLEIKPSKFSIEILQNNFIRLYHFRKERNIFQGTISLVPSDISWAESFSILKVLRRQQQCQVIPRSQETNPVFSSFLTQRPNILLNLLRILWPLFFKKLPVTYSFEKKHLLQ